MFKKLIKYLNNPGMPLPLAQDAESGKPSVTLLFAYGSFLLALGSVVYLLTKDPTEGTIAAISMALIYMILYRLRKLDKVSFSREKIELDAEDEK